MLFRESLAKIKGRHTARYAIDKRGLKQGRREKEHTNPVSFRHYSVLAVTFISRGIVLLLEVLGARIDRNQELAPFLLLTGAGACSPVHCERSLLSDFGSLGRTWGSLLAALLIFGPPSTLPGIFRANATFSTSPGDAAEPQNLVLVASNTDAFSTSVLNAFESYRCRDLHQPGLLLTDDYSPVDILAQDIIRKICPEERQFQSRRSET